MKIDGRKQIGYGNRIYVLLEDYVFNGYALKKGLRTDGGSVPKIYVIGALLLLTILHSPLWIVILYPITITENNGWFQKVFFAHDQRWQTALSWYGWFDANINFYKDFIYKLRELRKSRMPLYKKMFHYANGHIVSITYTIAVSTFGAFVFYNTYLRSKR